jgi:hypothetical protein
MAYPTLIPASNSSKSILAATGTINNITTSSLPLGVYVNSEYWSATQINLFKQGAAEQVAFVYKRLGGDVLDIEIVDSQVYAAYEEATLEYSYLVNLHQSKNVLSRMLGGTTGSFDSKGQLTGSSIDSAELKYPRWNLGYAKTVSQGYSTIAGFNGTQTVYSGSFPVSAGQQDYDLQSIISASATAGGYDYSGKVGDKRINILKVYYKTVGASWNFYGYFGGLNVVGNLSTYGQYADDSTFEVIPVWQNKLQAMAYEDAIKTRVSDWSYELRNNRLRLYPVPSSVGPDRFWFLFTIPTNTWEEEGNTGADSTLNGVNNINTIPFQNIAYDKINSMGKQWIRRYALALCKEMLGYIRSKFNTIPIPNENVTLNGTALVSEGKAEQKELKDELMKILDETTYDKLLEKDSAISKTTSEVQSYAPNLIYVG